MKKLLITILSVIMLFSITIFATGCELLENYFSFKQCEHTGGTATCIKKAECEICGKEYGFLLQHNYNKLEKSETQHWYECTCGAKNSVENHKGGTATCTEKAECEICGEEYGSLLQHNYTKLEKSKTQHWYECTCGAKNSVENHKGGTATCTEKAECEICGEEYGSLLQHNYTKLEKSKTQHWYECTCGAKNSVENHQGGTATYTEKAVCDICGESYGELLEMPATEGLEFRLINNDTEYEVIGYTGTSTEVLIPSIYKGKPVTSIGDSAFYGCTSLTSIEIPNSVTSIGDSAFSDCSSLTKVNYTGTIDQWVQIEFNNYDSNPLYYAKNLYINNELVTQANITTATKISNYAFYKCSSLTSIEIPNSVTSIGNYAFKNCSSLTSIVIPDSVTRIGSGAFAYCNSLTSIEIPNSVTSIGSAAFENCDLLTSIVIPNSVTSIGSWAFYNCTSLTSIVIPDSVTSIDNDAFENCSSLTSVEIPNSVEVLGYYAFSSCSSLTSIVIPNSVTSIGDKAFSSCSSLTSVIIPNSVEVLGEYAFYSCSSLTNIEVAEDNEYYKDIDGNLYSKDGTKLIQYAIGKQDTLFTIPASVTSIGDSAFYYCDALTSIVIPDSVISIGYYAFEYCSSLTSIVIPDSVTRIGSGAFAYCNSLTSIVMPDSVTKIGIAAFADCDQLTTIYCEAQSQPEGWDSYWKYDCDAQVVWRYTGN